jgi:hypothetical protein
MKAKDPDAVRITVQYRAKSGKIYELTHRESLLAVHISPPSDPVKPDSWHVEARLGTAAGPSLAEGWGATAADALRETGRAWLARVPSVTPFDWEAVTRELKGVQAV